MSRPTIDGSRAELRVPQPVRQDRRTCRASGFASSSVNARPRNGWRCSVVKKDGVTASAAQLLGLPLLRRGSRRAHREERRVLDRRRLRLAVDVVGNRHARLRQAHQRIGVPDEHQPVGVRVRQRPQQHLVEQAENRGVGADAERQRQDGDQREDRLLAERTERRSGCPAWAVAWTAPVEMVAEYVEFGLVVTGGDFAEQRQVAQNHARAEHDGGERVLRPTTTGSPVSVRRRDDSDYDSSEPATV